MTDDNEKEKSMTELIRERVARKAERDARFFDRTPSDEEDDDKGNDAE